MKPLLPRLPKLSAKACTILLTLLLSTSAFCQSAVDSFFNIVGLIGVFLMLAAYFLLQQGKMAAHDRNYLWMNFAGAVGMLFSLMWSMNVPAFIICFT